MDDKTNSVRTYNLDKIDDVICELDDSKIRINALIDYNLEIRRINNEEPNKNLLSHEYERLSPIIELLDTEVFESLEKAMRILDDKTDNIENDKKNK